MGYRTRPRTISHTVMAICGCLGAKLRYVVTNLALLRGREMDSSAGTQVPYAFASRFGRKKKRKGGYASTAPITSHADDYGLLVCQDPLSSDIRPLLSFRFSILH